jgi:hypothetical protein
MGGIVRGGVDLGDEVRVREWLSIEQPEERRTWLFDLGFLTSRWHCLFGCGCQGVLRAPAPDAGEGCCSYGAHLTGDADAARVQEAARQIPSALWQHHGRAQRNGQLAVLRRGRGGSLVTRQVEGACIFLNRPGFPGGAGCALHLWALAQGESPRTTKPEVCWQLPIRREDLSHEDGWTTTILRRWERRDWGPGGQEFAWWCTEAPEAYGGPLPVYRALEDELRALVGPAIYDRFLEALGRRPVRRRRLKVSGTPAGSR